MSGVRDFFVVAPTLVLLLLGIRVRVGVGVRVRMLDETHFTLATTVGGYQTEG